MRLSVEPHSSAPMALRRCEIVERKGLGHPDTMCDRIMERVCVELAAAYREAFGRVLHFNVDKAVLLAGGAAPRFGGGEVVAPMRLVMGDRAVREALGKRVDVDGIAEEAARAWVRENLRYVDADEHFVAQSAIRPGAASLVGTYGGERAVANDSSIGVGYAPLSPLERLTLDLEGHANSPAFHARHPEAGEDVKVLAQRDGTRVDLTVAMAFVGRHVASEEAYFELKARIGDELLRFAQGRLPSHEVRLVLNALDVPGRGADGTYLTVLGTSAEMGDSGEVGRGNRVNGLIAPGRPMSLEAWAGKNPVGHVGKIYNVLAGEVAEAIVRGAPGVREAHVTLASRIGAPLDAPEASSVSLALDEGAPFGPAREAAAAIFGEATARVADLAERLARRGVAG